MDKITMVIVDGSVIGTGKGPGGWAAWVGDLDKYTLCSGQFDHIVGNNTAELYAVLMGISQCSHGSSVLIWTDSREVIHWLNGKPIRDPTIKEIRLAIGDAIDALELQVTVQKIKGHHQNTIHNEVDEEAHAQAKLAYQRIYGES